MRRSSLRIDAALLILVAAAVFNTAAVAADNDQAPRPAPPATCTDIPGVEALFAKPRARIVWAGEVHGTNEMPALFGDMVCAAGAAGQPVVVLLERGYEEIHWNAYLAMGGTEKDQAFLLMGQGWSNPTQDGRSSQAMLALAEHLRRLKQAGRIVGVEMLYGRFSPGEEPDANMARQVTRIAEANPRAWVMVLSGNLHAAKTVPAYVNDPRLRPAASRLPAEQVVSVNLVGGVGGKAWYCRGNECGEGVSTGAAHARSVAASGQVSGELGLALLDGFDALAYTGMPTTASQPALAAALALIAPVHQAFAKTDAEQAKLPAPADDRERLERLGAVDQAGRQAATGIDFSVLPAVQQLAAQNAVWSEINARDLNNQAELKRILPKDGWFLRSKVGVDASKAAFLIAQHAVNDPELMRDVLRRIEPLVAAGEVDVQDFARMHDRIALQFDRKPQRYGTQVSCQAGRWQPETIEDPDRVDERRKAVGLLLTEVEYLAQFLSQPCH